MQIGVPKERRKHETRVAATPKSVEQLVSLGFEVVVEKGAGDKAHYSGGDYEKAGATISADTATIFAADVVLKVNPPEYNAALDAEEADAFREGATFISFIGPADNGELLEKLAEKKVNTLAMDTVPRLSRSQSLDALSSMANISGYRAVIEAAHYFGGLLGGQITAAGRIAPAKVLVIGAGVAGLAAIGAANSMGAQVRAFDTRPEVKEQIHSLGAEFLEVDIEEDGYSSDGYAREMSQAYIDAEMALLAEQAQEVDMIITTALIPGKPAPRLITKDMVNSMKAGSVIVDLAAPNGGNCELCNPGHAFTTRNQVSIIGYTDLASRLPEQASRLYASNVVNLIKLLCPEQDGTLNINFDDVVIRGVTVVRDGEVTWPAPPVQVSTAPGEDETASTQQQAEAVAQPQGISSKVKMFSAAAVATLVLLIGFCAPPAFVGHFTVFVLACIIGYYVVWNVTHSLHTPLMSVTNAISGIIVVGALVQVAAAGWLVAILSLIATFVATINIAGGFFVTKRMLNMFKK